MTGTLRERRAYAVTRPAGGRGRAALVLAVGTALVVVLGAVHLTQGTSGLGARDLAGLLTGSGDAETYNVFVASRLPRLLAGLVVGVALGIAGALLQSVSRNALASPDTLGVNAGAYVAVVAAAVFGASLPALPSALVAFAGGLAAAVLVLALSSGSAAGPTRLVLAGSVMTLALGAATYVLLLIDQERTVGLYAWGNGSLVQSGLDLVTSAAPIVGVGVVAAVVLARPLDLLALGNDTAQVLGVRVRGTRLTAVLAAVLLSAAAVTVAGPVGFVGLLAPTIVRLLGVTRHAWLLPAAAVAGCVVVLGADVLTRVLLGGGAGVRIPTGVVTSLFGAPTLVWLARRYRDSGPTRTPPGVGHPVGKSTRSYLLVAGVAAAILTIVAVGSLLAGDRLLLLGDVANWLRGTAGGGVTFILDQRMPRVVLGMLAGAGLGLAGSAVQAVARNPLAEPGILGVSGGAGVGAVIIIVLVPGLATMVPFAAAAGGFAAFAVVYLLAWRGGLSPDRLLLVGIGMAALTAALTTAIVVQAEYDIAKALTWLSGSTYGRSLTDAVPVAAVLAAAVPLALVGHPYLDLLALDDDTPRVLGVRLERVRLAILGMAVLLAAAVVSAVGVIGFVGLVAPHAARALVGGRHRRVLVVAPVLGAVLVCTADTLGRTVIAPAQLPAGLLTALLGAPYFLWLLWRTRRAAAG